MSTKIKEVRYVYQGHSKQWVGNGFHVYPLIRPSKDIIELINPFLLIDYAAPKKFLKTDHPKGVGVHPHRGFETVTFAYQGEIEHRDSSGGGGVIKAGDVQWMTAGKGVVHDEFHSQDFSQKGGIFEMVQLWVNLPKKNKMTEPKYQEIKSDLIPNYQLSDKTQMRIIAGEYDKIKGPSSTFSPINIYDIISNNDGNISIKLSDKTNTILLVLKGQIQLNEQKYNENSALVFEQEAQMLNFKSSENFRGLLLNAHPINEPVVTHGPFVMNTKEEIIQAIDDYNNGKMGTL